VNTGRHAPIRRANARRDSGTRRGRAGGPAERPPRESVDAHDASMPGVTLYRQHRLVIREPDTQAEFLQER
jgi:hypothetical protein